MDVGPKGKVGVQDLTWHPDMNVRTDCTIDHDGKVRGGNAKGRKN